MHFFLHAQVGVLLGAPGSLTQRGPMVVRPAPPPRNPVGVGIVFGGGVQVDLHWVLSETTGLDGRLNLRDLETGMITSSGVYEYELLEFADDREPFSVPIYVGVGALVGADTTPVHPGRDAALAALGRAGIALIPKEIPLEVFVELEPRFRILDPALPAPAFSLGGRIGFRVTF